MKYAATLPATPRRASQPAITSLRAGWPLRQPPRRHASRRRHADFHY